MYIGKIEKLLKRNGKTYYIGYWEQDESYNDAANYDILKYALAEDVICENLVLSFCIYYK